MTQLRDQVAIVTGGGRGIGRAAAATLAALGAARGWTASAASKGGIAQLTRSLAVELEHTGVTVCAYNPGPVATAMHERMQRASADDFELADEAREVARAGRLRDPKDAARVIAY